MTQPTAPPSTAASSHPGAPPAPAAPVPPTIPPEVQNFSEENGLAPYLRALVAFTRRVFPRGEMTVELSEDHETEGDWFILFGVDVTDASVDELVAAQLAWSHGLFDHCPSTHVHFFRYSLRVRA